MGVLTGIAGWFLPAATQEVDMADGGKCPYSRAQVRRAGKALGADIPADGLTASEDAKEAFRVAHAWRASIRPLITETRRELTAKARAACGQPVAGLTAGRLKRLSSIRRKLRLNMKLDEIQDIGGCRIILPAMADVSRVARIYREGGSRYEVRREDDYLAAPKTDGYRSLHMVLKHAPADGPWRPVELQLRTQLQHAWATAVEAVGLWRGEGLKFGEGCPDWLRLFALMSAELAEEEGAPGVPGLPADAADRRKELIDVERRLNAAEHLDGYRRAYDMVGVIGSSRNATYMLDFDPLTRRVTATPQSWRFDPLGKSAEREGRFEATNSVVVEADSVEALKAAYPNYFSDVRVFVSKLRARTRPREAQVFFSGIRLPRNMTWPKKWGRDPD